MTERPATHEVPAGRGISIVELARALRGATLETPAAASNVVVRHVRQDSRAVEPGDLFVARLGARTDGARYVAEAVSRGATAVLAGRGALADGPGVPVVEVDDVPRALADAAAAVYGWPTKEIAVVGVTGTNGKTTTANLTRAVVDACGGRAGVIGTLGYQFADLDLPATHTSPEADEIQRLARAMLDRGATHLAMEVSSIALAASRVESVTFAVAAFTNLSQDHLDYHGTMEAYAAAKDRLFLELGVPKAALFVDDPHVGGLAARIPKTVELARASRRDRSAELFVTREEARPEGTALSIATPEGTMELRLRLLGAHNVENALVCLGIARLLGLDPRAAAAELERARPVPGRLERCDDPKTDDVVVLVDYAHTPDALARVLASVRPLVRGKLVCVFGCGGDRDPHKRPLMGEAVGRAADLSIVTSDNPRSEDPRAIIDGIVPGLDAAGARFSVEIDRTAAIKRAVAEAAAGDVVLVAGKGHETYQVLRDRTISFDDRAVARKALAERRQAGGP